MRLIILLNVYLSVDGSSLRLSLCRVLTNGEVQLKGHSCQALPETYLHRVTLVTHMMSHAVKIIWFFEIDLMKRYGRIGR